MPLYYIQRGLECILLLLLLLGYIIKKLEWLTPWYNNNELLRFTFLQGQKWIWFDTLVFFSFPVHYTNQKPKNIYSDQSLIKYFDYSILHHFQQIYNSKIEISKFTTEFDKQTQTDSLHWVDWQCWIQIWQYSWSWEYSSLSFRLFLCKNLKKSKHLSGSEQQQARS